MIKEKDLYYPTEEFKKQANLNDNKVYEEAAKDPVAFWEKLAGELHWFKKWDKAFEHKAPSIRWFAGGKTNITSNIFEHNRLGFEKIKNKPAIIWQPEPLEEEKQIITYGELFSNVNKLANALKKLGVKKGDRVGIYLPVIPEVVVAMLACAKIGAVHSVVFSAFSSHALQVRLQDTEAKVLITADGYYRGGNIINLKNNADEGVENTSVEKIVVVNRLKQEGKNSVSWVNDRDFWFEDLIANEGEDCEVEQMDAEDLFFILYTSGSTGKPKGCIHTCGGYMTQAYWTGKYIFDFKEDDIYWCTSDPGWVTGHTYTIYSPLLNGVTTLLFEGVPNFPATNRWADIIEENKVSIFYTAPTAIRMFEKYGAKAFEKNNLSTIRLLGSVGEPIDEASWLWYFNEIGKGKCPLVDTWWQTETGGILITSLPGIGPFKPAHAGRPLPGIKAEILDEKGNPVKDGEKGNLVILPPFSPGLLRGIYKNPEKFLETYWKEYGDEIYFTSDSAMRDSSGLIRVVGRMDDVLKVAGHRLSTGELEAAANAHLDITESAAIGIADEIKGEVPVIFVVYKGEKGEQDIKAEIIDLVKKEIGPIALPKEIYFAKDLPKTRSGKIMRRILRKLFSDEDLGDLSTLANPESVDSLKELIKNNGHNLQVGKISTGFLDFIFVLLGLALIWSILANPSLNTASLLEAFTK